MKSETMEQTGSMRKKIRNISIERFGRKSECKRTVGKPKHRCDHKIAFEDIKWDNLYLTHLAQGGTGGENL